MEMWGIDLVVAMILAGGVGSRVGADRPKQFVKVLGKPVLVYTIEIFQNHPDVDVIEVVCHKEWKNYLRDLIEKYNLTKVLWIVDGGERFQESVINGLKHLKDNTEIDWNSTVLVHYGAAPFTSDRIVTDCIKVTEKWGSACSTTPCYQLMGSNDLADSLHEADKKVPISKNWVDRDRYIQIACPQGYKLNYLASIYHRAEEKGLLDRVEPHTTSLAYELGDVLYQSYGDQTNIKITTKEDIELFEGYVYRKWMQENKK